MTNSLPAEISGSGCQPGEGYQAGARFLRALSYWHALDLYGNPTFVTENDAIGAFLPPADTPGRTSSPWRKN